MEIASSTSVARLGRIRMITLSDGSLNSLKWFALVLMTVDHINAFVFKWKYPLMLDMGRLVMPIFGFVLAYNLARPCMDVVRVAGIIRRLLIFGVLAQPAYVYCHGSWPFNILFTLALFAFIVLCVLKKQPFFTTVGIVAFGVGGAFVEFWWFALAFLLTSWQYCRKPSIAAAIGVVISTALLSVPNQNFYAMLALPLLATISYFDLKLLIPRMPRLFYWYYPSHLTALVGIAELAAYVNR